MTVLELKEKRMQAEKKMAAILDKAQTEKEALLKKRRKSFRSRRQRCDL